ncbi:MAG: hypothetical protein O7J95_02995 [Planctomycetota bacterium]|nr:hypothetical protein [Planctomycetota bacterium]
MAKTVLDRNTRCFLRHLHLGWWSLLLFLSLGIALETLHGFKVSWYMDVSNSTRRLMWTLAHTHGTLVAVVHIVFGLTLQSLPAERVSVQRFASPCLTGAIILLPGGFLLGGVTIHGGDPGRGILLVPVGAALLFFAVLSTAVGVSSRFLSPAGSDTGREGDAKS